MSEELGRITRPATANYQGKRKLLLVPLVHLPGSPDALPPEGVAIITSYWEQVDVQVRAIQNALGSITRVFHENIPEGDDAGIQYLEMMDLPSSRLVRSLTDAGASLEATESMEILAENLDLQRCLMAPLMSQVVADRLQEWFSDANRRRYQHISQTIDAVVGDDETALLLINERHQVQFPPDVEVIYIAPPALDEFRRWVQNWAEQRQAEMSRMAGGGGQVEAENSSEDNGDSAPDS